MNLLRQCRQWHIIKKLFCWRLYRVNGDFYQFIGDVGAFADEAVVAANLSEVIGSDVLPFDGKIKFIENPTQNSKKSRKVLVRLD